MKDVFEFVKYLLRVIRFFTVAKKLKRRGFIKSVDVEHFMRLSAKIIAGNVTTTKELISTIKRFRQNFPHAEKLESSTWSPYGDKAIFEALYSVGPVRVAFWLETEVDSVPSSLLKPGCRFVKEERSSFSLVCELQEVPHG